MAKQEARSVVRVAGVWTLVGAALLTGCGERQPTSIAKPKYRIALVMKSLANEFFKTMEEGAKAHQKKNASVYELIANGIKDESDTAGQIAIVEQMIADRVHAIVIAPADSKALVPVCKKALDAGIVVVNIDNKFDDEALAEKQVTIPFVGPDNRKGARLAGECLARKLKADDTVGIVEGRTGAFNALMRKLGFQQAMDEANIKVAVSQVADWEMDKAEKAVSGMITQHPDLKGILCANDSMALGAVSALKAAGKLGSVLVVGYDNISAIQQYIREGKVLCTIDQHADQIAVFGVRFALDILAGREKPQDRETPVDLITAEELKNEEPATK